MHKKACNSVKLHAFKIILFLFLISAFILVFSLCGNSLSRKKLYEQCAQMSQKTLKQYPTIIIDAGHGGEDGGAQANGVVEKDVNLSIALTLSEYLSLSEYNFALTRSSDTLLYKSGEEKSKKKHDILNRADFAQSHDNAIFISIHQNKFEIPKYKGLQVYYSPNNNASEILAQTVQSNSQAFLDKDNTRQIKQADYKIKLLDLLEMPAVLVECGFLSNPEEAALLNTKEYQNKVAFVLYLSIVHFLEDYGDL